MLYGDAVRTQADSAAHIVFSNGDAILLQADSELKLSSAAQSVSATLVKGECLFVVKRTLAPGETFTAATEQAQASLNRGLARLSASADQGSIFQSASGTMTVVAQGRSILLEPGKRLHLAAGQPAEEPQSAGFARSQLDGFALDGSVEGAGELLAEAVPAPPIPQPPAEPAPAASAPPIPQPPAEPAPAPSAAPGLKLELHPHYTFSETYDDNIYLVPRDQAGANIVGGGVRSAWISMNDLGFNYAAPLSRKHKISGNADFTAQNYSSQPRANNAYDTAEKIGYSYSGRDMTFDAFNAYENTMIPAFSELVARQRHWTDTTGVKLEVVRSRRFYYELDGQDMITKYLDPTLGGLLNRYEQSLGGRLGLLLAPKTKAFFAYHRGIIHYSTARNTDSKSHSADAGVEGVLTPKIKGLVQFGWQSRYYDGSLLPLLNRVQRAWQSNVTLEYAATRNLHAKLTGFRNFTESTFSNNRYYTAGGANLDARYTLRRLTLRGSGGFEIDRYPELAATAGGLTANRRDDLYNFGTGADYKVCEWFKAGLSFNRINRFSIFSRQFNYADDRTSADFKVEF